MLLLVRADGYDGCVEQQDIGSHQHGVGEETRVDVIGMLGGLVLELGHAVELAHIGEAVQDPCQLRMAGNMALAVDDVLFGIQTGGDIDGGQIKAALAQRSGILTNGDGMHIHHTVEALVFVLRETVEVAQRADIVADGQRTGRLNAGINNLFRLGGRGFHKNIPP